jgi:outer membrane receptor protein involved in Fe transport
MHQVEILEVVNPTPRLISRILLALAAMSSPSFALAQEQSFSGRIIDERSKNGVAGATISIVGHAGTAKTDAEGRFTWSPGPEAPFQVIVLLPSGQIAGPIIVEQTNGQVELIVNPLARESLTVVGVAPSITTTPAAATTLLSARQIAQRAPEHLLQALETVPGVNQVSEGHASVPAIRGLARGRTLLLIDGGRVSSERRVGPSATFSDPAVFEGIDVARGPGSVAYGSDALGGVISVRTRRAAPGSPLQFRGSATLGVGIPDRRGVLEVSKGLPRGGVIFQTHWRSADDWDGPEGGEILDSGWKDRGFLARIDHQVGRGVLSVGLQSDFGKDIERPRNNSNVVRFYSPYEDSHRFTGSYELVNLGGFQQIAVTGFVGTFEQRTDQDRYATAATGRSIERGDVSAKDFHVKGSAVRAIGTARVELGVDVNGRYDLNALDIRLAYDLAGTVTSDVTNVSVDTAHRTDTGAYVQAALPVAQHLRLSGGLRGDRVTTTNSGGFFGDETTDNGAFSGFGSATIGPFTGLSFTAQVARGFRDPTLSDRYYRGPSGRGFITGNPDLSPESSLQYDLAARYTAGTTQLAAYFYHYRIDDLVERFQTQTDFFFFRNRGRARVRGFEVEARTALPGGVSLELGASAGRGVALDEDANLDDIAPDTVSVLARKDFAARAFAQLRAAFLTDDDRPGPGEIAAPGATLLDLAGGFTLTRNLELRASLRNLLNETYYASPDPRWVHAPGRSASITVAVQF